MNKITSLAQLLRLHQPVGTILVLMPTLVALSHASKSFEDWDIWLIFCFGAILIRGAGCIVNDIQDRNFDFKVSRTQNRPITTGKISVKEALVLLTVLLAVGLILIYYLNPKLLIVSIVIVISMSLYPLFKRFFPYPQLILSFAFNLGIPFAYICVDHPLGFNEWLLFIINAIWIFKYDTVYALFDKPDDTQLGLHSSAISLGNNVFKIIVALKLIILGLIAYWLYLVNALPVGKLGLIGVALVFMHQWYLIKYKQKYITSFKLNQLAWLLLWMSLLIQWDMLPF